MMTTLRARFLAGAALAMALSGASVAPANAAEPFRCAPGELYAMNVMVSGVEYWVGEAA